MQRAAQSQGSSTDDRLYAFEAAGQLLGTEDLPASEQEGAVRGLLQPLQQQIDEQLKAAGKASAGMLKPLQHHPTQAAWNSEQACQQP